MEDQTIRLGLKVQGREDVETLRRAHRVLKDEVYDLSDSYEVLTSDLQTATTALKGMDAEAKLAKSSQDALAASAHKVQAATATHVVSTREAAQSTAQFNRSLLLLGQGVQDFQAAGLLGISNNLDQMVLALGGPAGLAALTIAVGAGFLALKGPLGEFSTTFVDAMRGASESVPLDKLTALEAQIKSNQKAIDGYRESQRLTGDELARYNGLVQEQTRLEKEQEKAREDAATRKKAADLKSPEEAKEEKRRAEILQGLYGTPEKRADLTSAVRQGLPDDRLNALRAEASRTNKAYTEHLEKDPLDLVGVNKKLEADADAARARLQAELKRRSDEAEQVVSDALVKGTKSAAQRIQQAVGRAPGGQAAAEQFTLEGLEQKVKDSDPEVIAVKKKAKADEDAARARAEKARSAAETKAEKARAAAEDAANAQAFEDVVEQTRAANLEKQGETKKFKDAEAKKKKDRGELEKGLGNDFLASAEAQRLAIENDPTLSPADRARARTGFGADLHREARRRLMAQGTPGARADELAGGAGGLVQEDIQKQLDMLRAQGGPRRTADAMAQLQQILLQSIQQQQMTGQQLSRIEARNRELERMQGATGWSAQRRVQ